MVGRIRPPLVGIGLGNLKIWVQPWLHRSPLSCGYIPVSFILRGIIYYLLLIAEQCCTDYLTAKIALMTSHKSNFWKCILNMSVTRGKPDSKGIHSPNGGNKETHWGLS